MNLPPDRLKFNETQDAPVTAQSCQSGMAPKGVQCPFRVNRVTLSARRSLPVFPD